MTLPERVSIYEVGPRDGLQNEAAFVPTEAKRALVDALAAAGLERIEITSFVNPRWIPALADGRRLADALIAARTPKSPRYSALVPNMRGLEGALEAGVEEVAVFMSASETHNLRNINKTREDTYPKFKEVFARCAEAGVKVRGYVSVVWGCPYEGEVPVAQTLEVAERLLDMGAYELSLGDTIGVGDPGQTERILEALLKRLPAKRLAMHMHDTRGTALANCLVGLQMGITTFDASVGGLGGCPYAPGASGNLATGDLVYMLERMGVETGIDLNKLLDAGMLASRLLGRTLPGRTLAAYAATCTNPKS